MSSSDMTITLIATLMLLPMRTTCDFWLSFANNLSILYPDPSYANNLSLLYPDPSYANNLSILYPDPSYANNLSILYPDPSSHPMM